VAARAFGTLFIRSQLPPVVVAPSLMPRPCRKPE
jgi:hypothetical protein